MNRTFFGLGLGGVGVLCAWHLAYLLTGRQELVLPSFYAIVLQITKNWRTLLFHSGVTILESVLGLLIGMIAAYLLAIAFSLSRLMRDAVYPYAVALKATPVVILAPLVSVWTGGGFFSKTVLASLVCFFPILVASFRGLSAFDRESMLLLSSYGATKLQVLRYLRIPASLPMAFSSLKIASTLAIVGAVIGELTGSEMGIGFIVNTSVYYLRMDLALAAVMSISLFGILLFTLITSLEKRIVHWAPEHRGGHSNE